MLGEVGLDRACRIPYSRPADPPYASHDSTAGAPRDLSPFTIPLAHQLRVLEAQLALAAELRRNVSFHSVKAQQATRELLDRMRTVHGARWLALSIDLHSCGLSAQTWTEISVSGCCSLLLPAARCDPFDPQISSYVAGAVVYVQVSLNPSLLK